MPSHSECCNESRTLCENLSQKLKLKIPDLQVLESGDCCSFSVSGSRKFAYIYHRKVKTVVEVWCSGDIEDLLNQSYVEFRPGNTKVEMGWHKNFPGRFIIDDISKVENAVSLLHEISYKNVVNNTKTKVNIQIAKPNTNTPVDFLEPSTQIKPIITKMDDGQEKLRKLSPTDISQFVNLEQCERYLRLRLHEKSINKAFMQDYGVSSHSIPPLLTLSGGDFEKEVEENLSSQLRKVNFLSQSKSTGNRNETNNNEQLVSLARFLPIGKVLVLFQTRIELELSGWHIRGDVDLLRLERDKNGLLQLLIIDMKSSNSVKVEHRLQVAFYQLIITKLFENYAVKYSSINTGILYTGSEDLINKSTKEKIAVFEEQRVIANRLLGTTNSYLEIIKDQQAYLDSVYDLVTGPNSTAYRITQTPFNQLSYHLSYKCDGCSYNEFCMKWSAEKDDLSLIPYMSVRDKNALINIGITTVKEVSNLKEIKKSVSNKASIEQIDLIPTFGKEALAKRIASTWPVGIHIDEIIYRAKFYRSWKKDNIEAIDYIPSKSYGSLPYSDARKNPNLVKIYIDAQQDYLQGHIYLLGALVVCCDKGVELPDKRQHIVHITNKPPESLDHEKELFLKWISETLESVVKLAVLDEESQKRAPIHIIFFNKYEQRILLDGLARHFSSILGATPFYDFITQIAAFDSPIVSFLDEEIKELKNYPMVCQSLQAVAAYLKFDWNKGEPYREIFNERMFDFWAKLDNSNGSVWYTNRARFGSQIPLEFVYAAWNSLPSTSDKVSDPFAPYRQVTIEQIKGFQSRRLEAIEYITKDFPGNHLVEKQLFNLPDLAQFTSKARNLAMALDEFLTIERHIELADWKSLRNISPEKRVLIGETLLVRYCEEDQSPELAAKNRENERRQKLKEQYRAAYLETKPSAKQIRLSKEQREETEWSQARMQVRFRIETIGLDCDLEEVLSLTRLEEGSRLILFPRLTYNEKILEENRVEFTPTAKQLLYGSRADLISITVKRDSEGKAISAYLDLKLQTSPITLKRGYAFGATDKPLVDGKLYTLDSDPNNYYGYWCTEVTEALCNFELGKETAKNTLYDRLSKLSSNEVYWPEPAIEGQKQFLAGLDVLKTANALHDFEPSKRTYIGSCGSDPILLVQGPPGTGKSYSTAFAIFARLQGAMAAGMKFYVYISCKTHAATDVLLENILTVQNKLKALSTEHPAIFTKYIDRRLLEIPLFRLSPNTKQSSGIITLTKDFDKTEGENKNLDELAKHQWGILGVLPGAIRGMIKSGLNKGESLLGHYSCNCLVLDEASQMNLPEAMMAALALYPNGQLIVVGDHRQMPPIVHYDWDSEPHRTFQEYKTYESLFTTLLTLNLPVIKFEESFRLHTTMAEFLRQEIYLKDGINYHSRKKNLLPKFEHKDNFVMAVLSPEHPIVVVLHEEAESQTRNLFEQELIAPILTALADKDLYALDAIEGLGVVVPHRMQRLAIKNAFPFLQSLKDNNSEETLSAVDTVERFQGGERQVILVSVTESDREYVLASSKFLLDPRRLNVAMSRAKEKMILVASRSVFSLFNTDEETFANLQIWKNLLRRYCTKELWHGEKLGKKVCVWGV